MSQLEFDVMRIKDVAALLGISRWTLKRWVDEDYFPKPLVVGSGLKVWKRNTVQDWIRTTLNPSRKT